MARCVLQEPAAAVGALASAPADAARCRCHREGTSVIKIAVSLMRAQRPAPKTLDISFFEFVSCAAALGGNPAPPRPVAPHASLPWNPPRPLQEATGAHGAAGNRNRSLLPSPRAHWGEEDRGHPYVRDGAATGTGSASSCASLALSPVPPSATYATRKRAHGLFGGSRWCATPRPPSCVYSLGAKRPLSSLPRHLHYPVRGHCKR